MINIQSGGAPAGSAAHWFGCESGLRKSCRQLMQLEVACGFEDPSAAEPAYRDRLCRRQRPSRTGLFPKRGIEPRTIDAAELEIRLAPSIV